MLIQVNIRRVKKLGVAVLKSGRGSDITLENHNSRDNSPLHNSPFSRSRNIVWQSTNMAQ